MAKVIAKDAADFFKSKTSRPSFDHRDVWREEHAIAFTVAKAVQMDVLTDIRDGLQKAIEEGKNFEQFRKELTPLLQKKGWWGKRLMTDPETGELKDVQLGSPRRLKTIYDANLRSARAAGQWERIQRTKKTQPYLLYELGPSENHRPEHKSWAGTILPVDHSFWQTYFTPNGYGCKCRIRPLSKTARDRMISRSGYTEQAPMVEYQPWENKRTGVMEEIPKGIDPGWDTNPGFLRQINIDRQIVLKAHALDQLDDVRDLMHSPVRLDAYQTWAKKMQVTTKADELMTVAVLGRREIEQLSHASKLAEEIVTVVEGRLMSHQYSKAGNALSLAQWQNLPQLISQAEHIFWYEKNQQLVYLTLVDKGYIKIVVNTAFKSKRRKAGWQEKLNRVSAVYIVPSDNDKIMDAKDEYQRLR